MNVATTTVSRLVLVVDDDHGWLSRVSRILEVHGFHPVIATPQQSLRAATTFLPDVVIAGPNIPDEIVALLINEIHAESGLRSTPIVALCDRFGGRSRLAFAGDRLIDRLHDPEGFDQMVDAVRVRSRMSPGRQALRELRRGLVGVRQRAAAQQEKMVATRMTRLFERMQRTPVGMLAADVPGRLLIVNDRLCTLTGFSRDELIDRKVWEMAPLTARSVLKLEWARLAVVGSIDGSYLIDRNGSQALEADLSFSAHVLPGIHVATIDPVSNVSPS
jgi:DNA-binding response OmpR family regulator